MAGLLIASVPLWVSLHRRTSATGWRGLSVLAVLVGFARVALLLLPGKQTGGAPLLALLTWSRRPRCGPAGRSPRPG